MRSVAYLAALGMALAMSGTAQAQDSTASSTATATTTATTTTTDNAADSAYQSGFRGFRLAANVGFDRFQSQGVHHDDVGYGAEAGFDGQIGRIVIGPSVSYWRSNDGENCTSPAGGKLCTKSFREVDATVRAGYLINPSLMLYAKGGYAVNYQRRYYTGNAGTGAGAFYDRYNTTGYQVGGGAEWSIGKHFFVDAEYRFSQYNDHTSRHRALAGFGVRF
jgi:outer membrane immunogenic protein